MKKVLLILVAILVAAMSYAQIGYQVSLLNSSTGEPRANETVRCTVTLSGQKSEIFTGTQNVTSNEFGVLSLTVGNADMFNNIDWAAQLPLFVEVSVDGVTIGKSQVLSVPVAEYAKRTGALTYENIGSKKVVGSSLGDDWETWTFSPDHTVTRVFFLNEYTVYEIIWKGDYFIDGNTVFGNIKCDRYGNGYIQNSIFIGHYSPETETIYISAF